MNLLTVTDFCNKTSICLSIILICFHTSATDRAKTFEKEDSESILKRLQYLRNRHKLGKYFFQIPLQSCLIFWEWN